MSTKKETQTFYDFKNGYGLIPAHRHSNGGGWVADTAHVEDTVYVGSRARVFGYANVTDNAIIKEDAEVSGYAVVKDLACVKGKAVIRGMCTIKDNAEISGCTFIASNIEIGKRTVLDGEHSFCTRDCLGCPALLDDNYGSSQNTKCLYCLEKASNSNNSSIGPRLPENRGINQNIDAKAEAPQKSGTDSP